MPIVINGSGTITGISTGGLNDDSIALADLSATGTASSSTFLRGDNSWAAAGGGKVLTASEVRITANTTLTDVLAVSIFNIWNFMEKQLEGTAKLTSALPLKLVAADTVCFTF